MYLQKLDLVRPLLGMVFAGQQSHDQATHSLLPTQQKYHLSPGSQWGGEK